QILDVPAIKRRDEGPSQRGEHLARDFIGLILPPGDLQTALRHIASAEQGAQSFRPGKRHSRMPREKLEEALFSGHECPKPAEHDFSHRPQSPPTMSRRRPPDQVAKAELGTIVDRPPRPAGQHHERHCYYSLIER